MLHLKHVIALTAVIFIAIPGCKKTNETKDNVFEATINGVQWKASTVKVTDTSGNFKITAYSNDDKVFYLNTADLTPRSMLFRQQDAILTRFVASVDQYTGNRISLSWRTGFEANTDRFEIERSVDALNFQTLAAISGAGNSNSEINYSYSDKPPFFNASKRAYYRIKMIDRNTTWKYSQVIVVSLDWPVIYKYGGSNGDWAFGVTGSLNVTSVDLNNRKISGTFNFTYLNDRTGLREKVENGVFTNLSF